ncbi:MAG: GspE/PulE family protein [Proteobacteria bacterium]|nr:GspE/PulE family protein [Pseudomonadota bacterium]
MSVPASNMAEPGMPVRPASKTKPLGVRLIDAGYINEAQLNLALREKDRGGGYLGEVLVSLGFISEDVLTESLAVETHTQVVDVLSAVIHEDVLQRVPYAVAKRHRLLPLAEEGGVLTVAMADPFDIVAIDAIEQLTGVQLEITSAPDSDIADALERHYAETSSIEDTVEALMRDGAIPLDGDEGSESPMVRLADQIIAHAVKLRATDIHIEPEERIVRIRMRVDGVLRQEILIPSRLRSGLAARVKLMAELNVTEKRVPQDGRIRFLYGRRDIDLRISTLPTNHGESIVMRVLESSDSRPNFSQLGFSDAVERELRDVIERPFGMVLVTGPTGSGKTTTLYTALSEVDALRRSIFTLEDPIEYAIPLVRQTQVRSAIGMTFAAGLRALLRRDPDVILVGEMRDVETAQLAVRAALTGHLVFSTLHTNNAVGVIPRVIDMGVERYLLPSALTAIIGQRLVCRLCDACRVRDPAADQWRDKFPEILGSVSELWAAQGCERCLGSGYSGRRAIFEALVIDEDFHDPIVEAASPASLEQLALSKGMHSMFMDGLRKAGLGLTSVEEVLRVVR